MTSRTRLQSAARQIAANQHAEPSTPWVALRKIFIQERCDRTRPGSPVVGWKRGELAEVVLARAITERAEEWGDVGYYVAQAWGWLWAMYAAITPQSIIDSAVAKFERRAEEGK